MGKTYDVPRNVKGETRILYIFSIKSLISTIVFIIIGLIPYYLFAAIGLKTLGIILLVIFAAIGFGLATLTIPDSPVMGKLRKAGGEQLGDIVLRTVLFARKKNIYLYREGGKKLWDK